MRPLLVLIAALFFSTAALADGAINPPTLNQSGNGIAVSQPTGASTISTSVTINSQIGTSYAVASTDGGKLISASNAGAQAYTIVAATTTGYGTGFGVDIMNIGAGTVTLTPTTSTINGGANITIAPNQSAWIWSDGTNYHAIFSSIGGAGTVTNVATGTGLTGGPITSTGTIALAAIAADNLLANSTGSSAAPIATAIGSCSGASNALTYNVTTHAFGCNTISGSGTVNTGTTPDAAYYATSTPAVSDGGAATITAGAVNVTECSTIPANGICLAAAGTVGISANSTGVKFEVGATALFSSNGNGAQLTGAAASSTLPTLEPNRASATGWGAQAAGNISCVIVSVERCRFTNEGYVSIQATAPAVTGTGSPAIATGSTDEVGEATSGATATSLIITFNLTHTNAPFCTITSQGLPYTSYATSNTAITMVLPTLSTVKFDYRCGFH